MRKPSVPIVLYAVLALLLGELIRADNAVAVTRMDFFITAGQATAQLDTFAANHPEITLRVHTLDAIENLEDELSEGLPGDPRAAKRLALSRLKRLAKDKRAELEHAGTSIAIALHHGVMKYPAIVFQNEFVVYGIHDPYRALEYFHHWRLAEGS